MGACVAVVVVVVVMMMMMMMMKIIIVMIPLPLSPPFTPTPTLQHPCQGILAAPLIMGNDLRTMAPGSKEILQNRMAVQINQDPLGVAGTRISEFGETEIWARALQVQNPKPVTQSILDKTAKP